MRENHILTPEEQDVERRAFENLNNNQPALVEAYGRKFGNEVSTDNAREIVSTEYAASREARTRWSGATQRAAGALSDHLFEQALQHVDPDKPRVVLMTAGGTGAGKTTALSGNPEFSNTQFMYDSNLGSRKSSIQKIEAAKAAGNRVEIRFVHRDPVEALTGGVLPRAMVDGRVVSLEAHARMYRDSAENFRHLMRKYAGDPDVRFTAIDNSRGLGRARMMPLEEARSLRYSTSELQPKLRAALESEYAHGKISEQVYRATLGSSSPEAPGGLPRDPESSGPPAGGEGAAGRGVLGDTGRVGGGQSQPECPRPNEAAEAQPGSVSSTTATETI
jgi:hypothetical protein